MNGGTLASFAVITPSPDPAWKHTVAGDYDGDAKEDLIVQNGSTGAAYMWFMDGGIRAGYAEVTPSSDPAWTFVSLP